MGGWWVESGHGVLVFSVALVISSSPSIHAQTDPSTANLDSSWTNSPGQWAESTEWAMVKPILVRETDDGASFLCGFYCHWESNSCLFAVLIFEDMEYPQLVWSANRNNPVGFNATLQLTQRGDLILKDANGTSVWSTNTSGENVSGLTLTETGNLVLFDSEDHGDYGVWESFYHPTDSLVPGQALYYGDKLVASISASNWGEGLFSLSLSPTRNGLAAQMNSDPPLIYHESDFGGSRIGNDSRGSQLLYQNGTLYLENFAYDTFRRISIPAALSAQYMKLEGDGHLRVYEWRNSNWTELADILTGDEGECGYPLSCGRFGICSKGQCTCPPASPNGTTYFRPINERQPNLGCTPFPPISCQLSQYHTLLELQNTNYFALRPDIQNIDLEFCKQACLKNCSCKAALFKYNSSGSVGDCCLLTQVFSLKSLDGNDSTITSLFLKVQTRTAELFGEGTGHDRWILETSLGASFGLLIFIATCLLILWKRKISLQVEEDYLDWVPGMPARFSYHDLKSITENFSRKLGEGGFGSVFEGILSDGTKVAVKRLEGLGQVKKSFLAEVETIGSIHHVNLVRLIGFCAEKSHRLLVYEYMCNGSLDKWIFHGNQDLALGWECRRKIILDIAKGLAYLHEDCRHKIFHLDIKPQNILLDQHFRAKVSDFGLSKLIDKDQSQIVTRMRGTPGYLAPEWLSSIITEKVDVYSFGVVVLEILCGRSNIDRSQPEEDMHLLSIFKRKAGEEQLEDIIDRCSEDMQILGREVVEMMKLAAWCLQSDYGKRPSMSTVVKALEGSVAVEDDLDYTFSYSPISGKSMAQGYKAASATAPLIPSTLSGPR